MAALSTLLLLAAANGAPNGPPPHANWHARKGAEVAATASVRIISGARVKLGQSADAGSYRVSKGTVRLEDGSRQAAELVEFQ